MAPTATKKSTRISQFAFLVTTLVMTGFTSQARSEAPPAKNKLNVIASIFPLADWARAVGGDNVTVTTLLPPGANHHTYEPTPRDMRVASGAQVALFVGLQLDSWGTRVIAAAAPEAQIVALGDALDEAGGLPDLAQGEICMEDHDHAAHDHSHGHSHCEPGGRDPHFWLDPVLAAHAAGLIAEEFAKADPGNAIEYRARAEAYQEQLAALNMEVAASLSRFPRRDYAAFHNAYAYFANRYGLNRAAVIEEYPGKSPSDRYIKQVVGTLREAGIRVVFAEPQFNPRAAVIIGDEIGGRVMILDPLGSPAEPGRDDYIALIRYNTEQFAEAFAEFEKGPSRETANSL